MTYRQSMQRPSRRMRGARTALSLIESAAATLLNAAPACRPAMAPGKRPAQQYLAG